MADRESGALLGLPCCHEEICQVTSHSGHFLDQSAAHFPFSFLTEHTFTCRLKHQLCMDQIYCEEVGYWALFGDIKFDIGVFDGFYRQKQVFTSF